MNKAESVLEIETYIILWDFELLTEDPWLIDYFTDWENATNWILIKSD